MSAPAGTPPPFVSVVVETVTAHEEHGDRPLADKLAPALDRLDGQTYPRDRFEVIVVLDEGSGAEAAIRARCPFVRIARSAHANYFAHKNAGAAAARGELVALIDGDCTPEPAWIEQLVARLGPATGAVAGRTRYSGGTFIARTFSVPDFGNVAALPDGEASGMNVNNLLVRRDLLLAHRLDARIRRNGGCYFLYHTLRAHGVRILYEPEARVWHELEGGAGAMYKKHFERGFDGTAVYRLDDRGVLRGTGVFRRFGALGLAAIVGRRLLLDWRRLARDRAQLGIAMEAVPFYAVVMLTTRLTELAGGWMAILRPSLLAPAGTPSQA